MMKRYAEISTVVQVRPTTVLLSFHAILPPKIRRIVNEKKV